MPQRKSVPSRKAAPSHDDTPPYRIARSPCGLGMFATRTIPKDKFIIEYIGPRLTNAEVERIDTKYLFELNSRWTIDGATRSNTARYINHSCRPNGRVDIVRGKIKIYSKKTIQAGEEITYDYGSGYFEKWLWDIGCRCTACQEGGGRTGRKLRAEKLKRAAAAARRKLAQGGTPSKSAKTPKRSKAAKRK